MRQESDDLSHVGRERQGFWCKHDTELFSVAWPDSDEELFAGPKSRDQAEHLCDLIARSSFDPGGTKTNGLDI